MCSSDLRLSVLTVSVSLMYRLVSCCFFEGDTLFGTFGGQIMSYSVVNRVSLQSSVHEQRPRQN